MRRNCSYFCPVCGDENYRDELLFDMSQEESFFYESSLICEDCFKNYLITNHPDLEELPIKEAAETLGISYTTADSYLENEYCLFQEAIHEDR